MASYDNKVPKGEQIKNLCDKIKDEFSFRVTYGICPNDPGDTTLVAYVGAAANDTSFRLGSNPVVVVKFTSDVGAGATLNLNNTGAKAIKVIGEPIAANTIKGGDIVFLKYNGTNYDIILSGGRFSGGEYVKDVDISQYVKYEVIS